MYVIALMTPRNSSTWEYAEDDAGKVMEFDRELDAFEAMFDGNYNGVLVEV